MSSSAKPVTILVYFHDDWGYFYEEIETSLLTTVLERRKRVCLDVIRRKDEVVLTDIIKETITEGTQRFDDFNTWMKTMPYIERRNIIQENLGFNE